MNTVEFLRRVDSELALLRGRQGVGDRGGSSRGGSSGGREAGVAEADGVDLETDALKEVALLEEDTATVKDVRRAMHATEQMAIVQLSKLTSKVNPERGI